MKALDPKKYGFELSYPQDWVVKSMPYIQMGLTVMKSASLAGKLTGIAVKDVAEWLDSQSEMLRQLPEAVTIQDKSVDQHQVQLQTWTKQFEGIAGSADKGFDKSLTENIGTSMKELNALLSRTHPDWQEACGLVKATCKVTDETEWVLETDKESFEKHGCALMEKVSLHVMKAEVHNQAEQTANAVVKQEEAEAKAKATAEEAEKRIQAAQKEADEANANARAKANTAQKTVGDEKKKKAATPETRKGGWFSWSRWKREEKSVDL
uniref:Uncharacterized protein n=1 Tax=Haptolina ericina TaxID=156174 RepID=A0A7S3AUK0_9EUKA|mmetsp:Transcript_33909/g.76779  ORF Transcript_33909/g.76779 Transcript_33909/m.76779 type:complete len:266 (+) Transcript_33909:3-800(+)